VIVETNKEKVGRNCTFMTFHLPTHGALVSHVI